MTTTTARNALTAHTARARTVRMDLADQIAAISTDRDISEELRHTRTTEARAAATRTLAGIRQQVDAATRGLDEYTPPAVSDAALGRAADRLAAQLDAGVTMPEALHLAAKVGDYPSIAAVREAAAARIAIDQATGAKRYGDNADDALNQVQQAANVAAVRALTGPDRVAAADALLGKAQGNLARLELDHAELAALGRASSGLGHAVAVVAETQHLEALAAQLEQPAG